MALELDFTVKQQTSCTEILFTDLTGDYAPKNTGGWGVPNDIRDLVLTSTVTVTAPDGTVYLVDVTTAVTNDTAIIITASQVGGTTGTCITDGQYQFSWEVVIEINEGAQVTVTYTSDTKYFFFDCVVTCKVNSLFTNLDLTNCNPCNESLTTKINNALLAWAYLEALRNAACCGKIANFTKTLITLERMLNDNKCNSCE